MKILLVNQAFYPDVVSTAQHASDLASELASRGHEVKVICSSRAYDDAGVRYKQREVWKGINIERISCLGLGKTRKWRRAADFASFLFVCALKLMFQFRQDVTIAMTSPPLISFIAALLVRLKGGRLICWIMDLNPDEAVAAGWLTEKSLVARLLGGALVYALNAADTIVVLDRFMKDRVQRKGISADKLAVIPPWSHDQHLRYDSSGRSEFRRRHSLEDKFVVMYSGNHSPCHPLDTLLGAALRLRAVRDLAFCFVGGGSEFINVRRFAEQHALPNIVCLPYQPLDCLSASLSTADLHVVVLGAPFVGIVHPCKVYNILKLGIPFLYIGPERSHITDISGGGEPWMYTAAHGDVEFVVTQIRSARENAVCGHAVELESAERFSYRAIMPGMLAAIEARELLAPQAALTAGSSR
jgi:glycosyltransferase involved in cell wall biosynthesis